MGSSNGGELHTQWVLFVVRVRLLGPKVLVISGIRLGLIPHLLLVERDRLHDVRPVLSGILGRHSAAVNRPDQRPRTGVLGGDVIRLSRDSSRPVRSSNA